MSRTSSAHPLAGQREAINRGEQHRLLWPDDGKGAPVKQGETFKLRSCSIEITRVHRVQKGREWMWRAEFTRHVPYRPVFLARSATHPYTEDPDQAIRSQDDTINASTLYAADPMDNPLNVRTPPEPEAVPSHEVATLPTTVAARARFEQINREDTEKRLDRSMTSKLREVRIRARQVGADVSREMEVIAEATESARRKVRKAAA